MRLGINASIISQKPSGLGVYAENIIKQLARQTAAEELTVYTSFSGRLELPRSRIREISAKVQPSGIKGHLNRLAWTQFSLPVRLRADKIDLLFNTYVDGPFFPGVRQVLTVHDLLPLVYPREYPRQNLYFRTCVRALAKSAQGILACSINTKNDIMRYFDIPEAKIGVIELGYDSAHFYPRGPCAEAAKLTGGAPYLLYIGNLLPHKNVAGLIRAYAQVSKKFPHLLLIAGNKDKRFYPALQALANELGLGGKVLFLDYISYEQMPKIISSCSAFVFPSLYEGFGLPPLEAMACGVPVIVSGSSSMPEVCADAAVYVDPESTLSISQGMMKVLLDPALGAELIQKGLARAKEFSWEKTGQKTGVFLRKAFKR